MTGSTQRALGDWLPLAACILLFVLIGATVGLWQPTDLDETLFHLPTVLQFAEQFPKFDLIHYQSASGPLPYMFLAVWVRVFGAELVGLRLAVALFGLGTLVFLWRLLRRENPEAATLILMLVFTNQYFLYRSFSLYTVVPALFFGAAGLYFFSVHRSRPDQAWTLLTCTLLVSCAVLCRQIYVSYAAGLLAFAIVSRVGIPAAGETSGFRPAWSTLTVLFLPLLCAVWLFLLWGGTTPPYLARLHERHSVNLVQLDFVPLYFGFWFWPLALEKLRSFRRWMPMVGVLLVLHLWHGPLYTFVPESPAVLGTIQKLFSAAANHGIPTVFLRGADAALWATGLVAIAAAIRDLTRPYAYVSLAHIGVLAMMQNVYERFYLPLFVSVWLGASTYVKPRWPYVAVLVQGTLITTAYFATHL